jgi:hypothetical protein
VPQNVCHKVFSRKERPLNTIMHYATPNVNFWGV